jgi:tetratricopeptide (TPR) repeat protein
MSWSDLILCALAGLFASLVLSLLARWLEARPWKMRVRVASEEVELDLAHARESQSLLEARSSPREPQASIAPAGADELLVIVARFRGPEEIDPQQYLGSRLESELALHPPVRERGRIARYPDVIDGDSAAAEREAAAVVGREHGATLVIWGQHDLRQIAPHYLVTAPAHKATGASDPEDPWAELTDLDEFILELQPGPPEAITFVSLFTVGQLYYFAGFHRAAISLMGSALGRLPPDKRYLQGEVPLRCYRGTAYARLGRYSQAIAEYDRAIEIDSQRAALYANRGVAYARLGRYGWAAADYGRAIQIDPQTAWFYSNRGGVYAYVGEYGRAADDFDRAIAIAPQEARFHYSRACAESLRGYASGAIRWLTKAIELDAGYAQVLEQDRHMDRIRDDPRFKRFLARVAA